MLNIKIYVRYLLYINKVNVFIMGERHRLDAVYDHGENGN